MWPEVECVKVGVFGSRRALRPPSHWCSKGLHRFAGFNVIKKRRFGPKRCWGCLRLAQLRREWAELFDGRR